MEKQQKRVVLNLTTQLAEHLASYLNGVNCSDDLKEIARRIERTTTKQTLLERFKEQGIEPTKENIKTALNAALGGKDEN